MFLSILDEEVKGRWLADDDKLRPLFSLHDGNQTHLELLFFHSPQQSITNVIRQILHSAELRKINGLRRITSLPIIANSRDNGTKKTSFLESSFFCFISLVGDIMSVGRKSGIFYVDLAKIHDSKRGEGWKTGSECTAEKSWK